jgi:LPXTG-motif cell wall-anchored protein
MPWWGYGLLGALLLALLALWLRRRIQHQIDAVLRHKRLP